MESLCQKHKVKGLYFFGSAMTAQFSEKDSDVDVFVEMLSLPPIQRGEHLTQLWIELEQLFGRKVDLLTPQSLRNPFLRQEIERTKFLIYEHQSKEVSL